MSGIATFCRKSMAIYISKNLIKTFNQLLFTFKLAFIAIMNSITLFLDNIYFGQHLTLLGLGLIKINIVLANFNNPSPSLILNN